VVSGDTFKRFSRTLGAAPTAGSTGFLGSVINPGNTSGTVVSTTVTNVHSITLVPGIWIIFGSVNYNSFAGDYALASISVTSATIDNTCLIIMRFSGTVTQNMGLTRGVVVSGSNQTFYLVGQASGGVATSSVSMYAIRVG
jgi:hypothetical protein